jgi:hypothetical protein
VTRLVSRGAPDGEALVGAESQRDATTEGRRQAFVALAARLGVKVVTMDRKMLKAFPKHTKALAAQ